MRIHEAIGIESLGQEGSADSGTPGFFSQIATGFAKALPSVVQSAGQIILAKASKPISAPPMPMPQRQSQYPPQGAYAVAPGLSTGAIIAAVGGGVLFLGLLLVVLIPKKVPAR